MKMDLPWMKTYGLGIFMGLLSANVLANSVLDQHQAIAQKFVQALNQDQVAEMLALSDVPFDSVSQEWVTLSDGIGWKLGDKTAHAFLQKPALFNHLIQLSSDVETESLKGERVASDTLAQWHGDIGTLTFATKNHEVFIFARGMGDVEHIVLVGVNRHTLKVEGLYYN